MGPRTILYTGKGGVGKTSVAAATARASAAAGRRTLVLSTDPAHSLADSLELDVGAQATAVDDRLWAQQIAAQLELERNWAAVQRWLGDVLVERGAERIAAEELCVPPGLDELFSLLVLQQHVASGDWDVIVVDCAPTGETLRLLSFPDVARWWLDKVVGREARLLAAARPIARTFFDLSLPDSEAVAEVERLVANLVALNEILRASQCTLRLVMNPDRMVVSEAMRTFTYLNLYGFVTDAVVVNRIFPEQLAEGYFGAWRGLQQEQLARVEEGFAPVPVLRAPYFEREVVGPAMLDRLAGELFAAHAPDAVLHADVTQQLSLDGDAATLRLALPFAQRGALSLKKIGLELIVGVADQRRTIQLPTALAPFRPTSATLADGALEVRFERVAAEAVAGG